MKEMFAEIGENCYIEPPFHSNWGGKYCYFGKNVYANFNLTCVDDARLWLTLRGNCQRKLTPAFGSLCEGAVSVS